MKRLLLYFLMANAGLARANVVGVDTQNFNPTNDGLDFVTVHSSKTLEPGLFNLGVFLNYAVNSLPNYEDKTTQTRTKFKDTLMSSDMNFAVGLTKKWEAGLSVPMLLAQSVSSDTNAFHGEFAQTGVTEIRLMTKYRWIGNEAGGVATVFSMNINQTKDSPFVGSNPGPTFNGEIVADRTYGPIGMAVNLGYRLRDPGKPIAGVPIEPIDDQIIGSVGANYLLENLDTKLIGEIFASVPTKSGKYVSDRNDSSAELLLGAKTDLTPSLAFHFGGGTEIIHGTASPDWRVYTGLNWVIGPLFHRDRDVFAKIHDPNLKSLDDLDGADPFAGNPEAIEAFVARDVLFEFNSDRLQPAAKESLKRLVNYLNRPPGFDSLSIEGHTDSIGSAIYNLDLSQRRAETVRKTLIQLGLSSPKVSAHGFGESRPIASNGNYQGRAMNRRVEFKVRRSAGGSQREERL